MFVCLSVCLSLCLSVSVSSDFCRVTAVFLQFSENLARVICVPIRKSCADDFQNFDLKLKVLGNFLI